MSARGTGEVCITQDAPTGDDEWAIRMCDIALDADLRYVEKGDVHIDALFYTYVRERLSGKAPTLEDAGRIAALRAVERARRSPHGGLTIRISGDAS